MSTKKISINITQEELGVSLSKMIHSEHSVLISKIIIANLSQTEVGLQQLYLAFSGIECKLKFNFLDNVTFPLEFLYSWKADKPKTAAAGFVYQERVKGRITDINPQREYPYFVSYKYMDTSGHIIDDTRWCKESELLHDDSNELI
jgi:hypothetical protein